MLRRCFAAYLFAFAIGAANVVACSSSDKGPGGTDGGVTDGAPSTDSAPAGDPAPGKATMEATLSDPVSGFNGVLDSFHGLEAESKALVSGAGPGVRFATFTKNGVPMRNGLEIAVAQKPAVGMTFMVANDPINGDFARYQQQEFTTLKAWPCMGPVTFDSIIGKVYKFHFVLTCLGAGGAARGGVTVTGTGVGTLP